MLQEKYNTMREKEVMSEADETEDADAVIVAFGIAARLALTAKQKLRKEGKKIGLLRPITLFPFPQKELSSLAERVKKFIVLELNAGQMVEDVRLAVCGKADVLFYGRPGGAIVTPEEVAEKIREMV